MATKFSQFTAGATTANTLVVGFDSNLNTNNKYTLSQLAAGILPYISIDTIYTANSTIGDVAGSDIRTVTIGGTSQATANHVVFQPPNPANWGNKTGPLLVRGNGNDVAGFGVYNSAAQISGYYIRFLTNASYGDLGRTLTDAGTINQQGKWTINGDVGIGRGFVNNQKLTIRGGGTTSATKSLLVEDSNGDAMFSIVNDGAITIGKTGSKSSFTGQVSVDVGSGSNATINFNTGNIQEITIPSGATNFTPSNAVAGSTYMIKITQAGTSGTINWESSATVNWPGGTPPTLTTTNGGVDIITLICTVGGATGGTFYGTSALNFS